MSGIAIKVLAIVASLAYLAQSSFENGWHFVAALLLVIVLMVSIIKKLLALIVVIGLIALVLNFAPHLSILAG